jgi:hypothetical protein
MAHPQVQDGGDGLQLWKIDENILNEQWRTADKGTSSWELREGLTTHHRKKTPCYVMLLRAKKLDGFFGTIWVTGNGYEVWNLEC